LVALAAYIAAHSLYTLMAAESKPDPSYVGIGPWIALAGLLLNAVAHLPWADPLAVFGLLPILVKEAKEAFEGRACSCDC
jgi:hypothetical protein